jgi:preprotein translocase subunit YajC
MTYVVVASAIVLVCVLAHFYIIGMRKENEKHRQEKRIEEAKALGRKIRTMSLGDAAKHASERRRARRQSDDEG